MSGLSSDWVMTRLGDVLTFQVGFPFESRYFVSSPTGPRLVRNRDLRADDAVVYFTGSFSPAFVVASGDVLIGMDGDFSPCVWRSGRALLNQRVGRLRVSDRASQRFLAYAIGGPLKELEGATGATTVKHLSHRDVESITLPLPPRAEQERIAAALEDCDGLITTLERTIVKKNAIKQGMMQQLLSGGSRLPGFKARWSHVRLCDAGGTYGGLVGKVKEDFGTGSATFVTFMEVMAGARLLGRRLERVRVRPNERQNRVLRGDVLFNGSSETPEEVALAAVVDFDPTPATYLNSFCFGYRLKTRGQIDAAFLAHFFRSSQGREIVSVLAQGATRYNIAKTKLMQVAPLLPPIDEQRAIVSLLRDVELEIEALNTRLTKARDIKVGMMQQLLTGRTRLPVTEAVA